MDFYFFSPDDVEQRTVWFIDGSDVPYMALSDWPELVEILMAPDDDSDVLHGPASNWIPMCDYSMEGNVGLLKRKDGYTAAFDTLADNTGLKPDLSGTDPHLADGALYQLLNLHLDDQHTCMLLPSPLNGFGKSESFFEEYGLARSGLNRLTQTKAYGMARMEAYPDGIPTYEEIGNTAYITFDRFTRVPDGVDYYQAPPTEDADDTMGIMIYAYSRITRPDSPIENVVLDLSCNMGGIVDAGIFTLAAFLGTSSVSQYNPLSGAMITANHQIDINLDGRFDEGDLGLVDKNLFCLESPVTFSCGSLVACAFKDSNRVALIGRACGGGSCNVVFMSAADGAVYQISGLSRTSFLKNGAFYDIDRGAEPDLPLLKPASFYDRQALTEYINQIR